MKVLFFVNSNNDVKINSGDKNVSDCSSSNSNIENLTKFNSNFDYKRSGDSDYVRPKRRNTANPSKAYEHAVNSDVTISN